MPDRQIAAVEVLAQGPEWKTGKVQKLFRVAVPESAGTSDYHVTADGQRFVVNTLLAYPPVPPVQVVVNWTALLVR
jgi:hypothetical protein